MKTITEFSGFALKEALAKKTALLAEGKSEEEVQAAINEILKLDETKVSFYKNAVDMTASRMDRVKRVVVATKATEGEKVPEAFMEREGHFYLVEFFPAPQTRGGKKEETTSYHDDFARGRTGGGRGRGGPGRGGSDRDRGRPERGNSERGFGERKEGRGDSRNDGRPTRDRAAKGPRGDKPAQRPARPQRPAGDRPQRGPRGAGELRLVLKGQTTTLPGSGAQAQTTAQNAAPTQEAHSAEASS